jgi:hypothetical protein
MRQLLNKREFIAAGLMMLIGLSTVFGSLGYRINELARMGPGYFPLLLGAALVIVSALMLAGAKTQETEDKEETSTNSPLRPWLFVTAGVISFMVLGKYGGFVPATFSVVFLSALGDRSNSLHGSVILATAMTIMAVAVFNYGLKISFPLFSWG